MICEITKIIFQDNRKRSVLKKAIIFGYHEIGCILLEELKKNNIEVSLIVGDYTKHENQIHSWYRDIRKLAKDHKIQILEKKKFR